MKLNAVLHARWETLGTSYRWLQGSYFRSPIIVARATVVIPVLGVNYLAS